MRDPAIAPIKPSKVWRVKRVRGPRHCKSLRSNSRRERSPLTAAQAVFGFFMDKKFLENINLSEFSNYRIGGPARYFFEAKSVEEIAWAIQEANAKGLAVFVLGGGTNLLINDAGFDGLVLRPALRSLEVQGATIRAGASVAMSDLLNFSAEHGLSGLEWAGGLPGTLGGAIRGNAGCFGKETKDIVTSVVSLDARTGKTATRNNQDCRFSYRTSVFKEGSGAEIILSAELALTKGDPVDIKKAIQEKIDYRTRRHPMDSPNAGSIFKNVDLRHIPSELHAQFAHVIKQDPFPVVPAAYLISEAGLAGVSFGGAMISPKHPNFIVNVLEAKAADVKELISLVKGEVKQKFGIELEEEVMYV